MSGFKNPPTPDGGVPTVREAARRLLADLDATGKRAESVGVTLIEPPTESSEALRQALAAEVIAQPPVFDPALAQEGIALIKRHAPPGELTAGHITAVVDAAEASFVLARSFEVRLDADRRAIQRWQAGDLLSGETRSLLAEVLEYVRHEYPPISRKIEAHLAGTKPGARALVWPDGADLVVWLLELIELRPTCPSPDEVDAMIRKVRAVFSASPIIAEVCEMMGKLANALIASSRRTVVAEATVSAISGLSLIATGGDIHHLRAVPSHPEAEEQGRQMRLVHGHDLVSGCEASIVGDLGRGSMEETHAGDPPDPLRTDLALGLRVHDSLRVVLGRPDVQEAIARGLAVERGADWQNATEAGRQAFREEAAKLLGEAAKAPRGG